DHAHLRHARGELVLFRGGGGHRHRGLRCDRGTGQVPAARRGDRMSVHAVMPMLLALPLAAPVVLGALATFSGAYGLLRLGSFYERVHAPTMGATLGTFLVLGASMLYFSALESRPVLHEMLIGIFMVVATPVTFVLLVRAAMHRDGIERASDAPKRTGSAAAGSADVPQSAPE